MRSRSTTTIFWNPSNANFFEDPPADPQKILVTEQVTDFRMPIPDAGEEFVHMTSQLFGPKVTTPTQTAPAAGASSGGYLVQVSSQRSEADAQSSYKALQVKFPAVLGSRQPVIKRADLADKGVYYRAMVGPFGTPEEASQFCGSLKSAGGQCVVQRN